MPPQRTRHPQPNLLSWSYVPARRTSLCLLEKDLERKRLEQFRRHLRVHDIPYFNKSHKVLVRGLYARQFFSTSLGALLSLDYVPRKVKIPTKWIPHRCIHCAQIDNQFDEPPFKYVLEVTSTCGRPRRTNSDNSSSNNSDTTTN